MIVFLRVLHVVQNVFTRLNVKTILLFLFLLSGSLFINVLPAHAATDWYCDTMTGNDVNAGNGADVPFKTINRALQALQAGDTIHIAPGVYYENLSITADSDYVTIIGDSEAIDGTPADSSNVLIKGNGINNTVSLSGVSGAVITSIQVLSQMGLANFGYGISANQSDSNYFQDLTIEDVYRGIQLTDSDSNQILSCYITQSKSAGIYLFMGCENTMICSNVIVLNEDRAIAASSSCARSIIRENIIASNDEGFSLSGVSGFLIEKNLITTMTRYGVSINGDSNVIRNNLITNNGQGGMYLGTGSYYYVTQNDIFGNGSSGNYYGLYVSSGANVATFSYNNIAQNHTVNIKDDRNADHAGLFNYYGSSDSQAISDSITMVGSRLSWRPFRFDWIDTKPGADALAPASLDTVSALVLNETSVLISWAVSARNEDSSPISDLGGYRVFCTQNPSLMDTGDLHSSMILELASTSFIDSGLTEGETYYYYVTAFDLSVPRQNEGWYSAQVSAVPQPTNTVYAILTEIPGRDSSTIGQVSLVLKRISNGAVYNAVTNTAGQGVFYFIPNGTYHLLADDTSTLNALIQNQLIPTVGTEEDPIVIPALVTGDANNDNAINDCDRSIITTGYGQAAPPADFRCDINRDGMVNDMDDGCVNEGWGRKGDEFP